MPRLAALILTGNALASALLLARALLVARLIPVQDFGIAATFAIIVALVEMASALGLQQQIVRDGRGDDPHRQAALQGFQLLRGALAAAALWLLAEPLAQLFAVPQAAWAYRWLALVPLLAALTHFDIFRLNRAMRFGPLLVTAVLPAAMSLAMVWPLASWLGDYRVMLCALLAQAGLAALASHLLAERRYRLALDRAVMRDSLRFGWPILLNGALLFAVFNGDRVIVGHALGMEALALLSVGLMLTLTPALVMERSAQVYFLPQLALVDRDSPAFARLSAVSMQAHLLAGGALVVAVLLLGPPLLGLALGDRYTAAGGLLPWLAVQQALRLAKNGASPPALATGQSALSLWVGLPRALCLIPAAAVAVQGGGLMPILILGAGGEAAGLVLSLWLVRRQLRLPLKPVIAPTVCLLAVLAAALIPLPPVVPGLAGVALLATMPDLRAHARGRAG